MLLALPKCVSPLVSRCAFNGRSLVALPGHAPWGSPTIQLVSSTSSSVQLARSGSLPLALHIANDAPYRNRTCPTLTIIVIG
jgi:hypothetical protein